MQFFTSVVKTWANIRPIVSAVRTIRCFPVHARGRILN